MKQYCTLCNVYADSKAKLEHKHTHTLFVNGHLKCPVVEIDDDLAPIIKSFNSKGYKTKSSHIDNTGGYIEFLKPYYGIKMNASVAELKCVDIKNALFIDDEENAQLISVTDNNSEICRFKKHNLFTESEATKLKYVDLGTKSTIVYISFYDVLPSIEPTGKDKILEKFKTLEESV